MIWRRRLAALFEVFGIYVAGQWVTEILIRGLHLRIANPLATFNAGITNAELLTASWQMGVLLILQYAGYFLLILPLNLCHRRGGPSAFGLTRAGWSSRALLLAGMATVGSTALIMWPATALVMADWVYKLGLGETVPWRQALFDTSWRRWEFWLFLAVLSFGLVACLEELFYRGYCQRRLAEDWGDGPAIVGASLLFVFSHGQYLNPNLYNLCMVFSVLVLAIGFGVIFAWTRSLIPSMLAHAIINVPMVPRWAAGFLVAYVIIGIVVVRRGGWSVVKGVFRGSRILPCIVLGVVGIAWAIASQRIAHLEIISAAIVVIAACLEFLDRRRSGASRPAEEPAAS